MASEKQVLTEDIDEIPRDKRDCCNGKRILLGEVLPVSVLAMGLIVFLVAGGGIFLRLEGNLEESMFEDFGRSVEYCVILLSTIGWGHVYPVSNAGQLATVFYGLLGIPLFYATFFKIGAILADCISALFSLLIKRSRPSKTQPKVADDSSCVGNFLALFLGLFLFLVYLLGTTVLYTKYWLNGTTIEDVNFIKSLYANFITLSTVGFGDYVPLAITGGFYTYLFFGLSLIAMNVCLVKNFLDDICSILRREMKI